MGLRNWQFPSLTKYAISETQRESLPFLPARGPSPDRCSNLKRQAAPSLFSPSLHHLPLHSQLRVYRLAQVPSRPRASATSLQGKEGRAAVRAGHGRKRSKKRRCFWRPCCVPSTGLGVWYVSSHVHGVPATTTTSHVLFITTLFRDKETDLQEEAGRSIQMPLRLQNVSTVRLMITIHLWNKFQSSYSQAEGNCVSPHNVTPAPPHPRTPPPAENHE